MTKVGPSVAELRRQHAAEALGQDYPTDTEQPWYFTFGYGHFLFSDYAEDRGCHGLRRGIPLADRYVVIHGTFMSARERMIEIFGSVWCDQYEALPVGPGITWRELVL
jgi:hypothetical protein